MEKFKKIWIWVLLAAVFVALAVVGCIALFGGSEPSEPEDTRDDLEMTDSEAVDQLKKLLPISVEVNDIFFGKGLAYDEASVKGDTSTTNYVKVTSEKFTSIKSVKEYAATVYSADYLSEVYELIFVGVAAETGEDFIISAIAPRYVEIDGEFMVDASNKGFSLATEISPDTAKVVKKTPDYITVEVEYSVGGQTSGTLKLNLVPQDGEWRLDTPTY